MKTYEQARHLHNRNYTLPTPSLVIIILRRVCDAHQITVPPHVNNSAQQPRSTLCTRMSTPRSALPVNMARVRDSPSLCRRSDQIATHTTLDPATAIEAEAKANVVHQRRGGRLCPYVPSVLCY